MSQNLQSQLGPEIQVIAFAVERDSSSLSDLLRRNGALIPPGTTKLQLQKIVTQSLMDSETFRREFKNWVLQRSGLKQFSNAAGSTIEFLPGLGGIASAATSASSSTTATTPPATAAAAVNSSFWSGVTLNGLLDFASTNYNNYASVVKSQADKSIVDSAIERERLSQETGAGASGGTSKAVWVIVGILAVAGIGTAIYFATKKK